MDGRWKLALAGVLAGLVGCTIEDYSGNPQIPLYDFGHAKERVAAAAEAARKLPFPLMLTARAEGFLRGNPDLDDAIKHIPTNPDPYLWRGELEKAQLLFEKLLGYANHLGLYSEELGADGRHLGNFPQAFTHLALISAATYLDRALSGTNREVWR